MTTMASQITSISIVYLTVCSGPDQRKDQSSASLAFVRGIHRWPVNSSHKRPVTRKMVPFDDVIMNHWWPTEAIIWPSDGLVYWRIYASFGPDELPLIARNWLVDGWHDPNLRPRLPNQMHVVSGLWWQTNPYHIPKVYNHNGGIIHSPNERCIPPTNNEA